MTWFNSISQLNAWRFFSSVAAVRRSKNSDGYHARFSLEWTCRLLRLLYLVSTFGTHILHELLLLLQHMLIDLQFNKRVWYTWESLVPICSMVLEYLPTFARTKSPSFVGKYTTHEAHDVKDGIGMYSVMAQNTSYKYWNNPIYRIHNPIEITSYNW